MSRREIEQFWMIYGAGQRAPAVRHKTFEGARIEAERLARANPGVDFFVLAPVARARRVDVEFDVLADYSPLDGIPF